jgi:hypothetical protein
MQLGMVVQRNSRQNLKKWFGTQTLWRVSMLDYYLNKYPKKQNKRMKPLESKDPDLFTISVQFLFRICMEFKT